MASPEFSRHLEKTHSINVITLCTVYVQFSHQMLRIILASDIICADSCNLRGGSKLLRCLGCVQLICQMRLISYLPSQTKAVNCCSELQQVPGLGRLNFKTLNLKYLLALADHNYRIFHNKSRGCFSQQIRYSPVRLLFFLWTLRHSESTSTRLSAHTATL